MEHVAIMRKSWGLLEKIANKEKTIESRWYQSRRAPWGRVRAGDVVYFKNSGEPVTLKTKVKNVFQYDNLTPERVAALLEKYGKDDGISPEQVPFFFERFKNKKYCILIFLESPQTTKPFSISKKGFGAMASWLCVSSIAVVKVRP